MAGSGSGRARLRRAFVEWVEAAQPRDDPPFPWTQRWLFASAMHAALMVFTALTPGISDFFRLRLAPVLGLQLLSLGVGFAANELGRRRALSPVERGLLVLAIGFSFQLCYSAPVVFSQPPGTFVFAAVPIIAAFFHANLRRATLRAPYLMGAHGLAMAVAYALHPDAVHGAVFATVAPLGLLGGLISGSISSERGGARAALDDHRSAISAQIAATRAEEVARLSESLAAASALRSEAAKALADARRRTEDLLGGARAADDPAALVEQLGELRASLVHLAAISAGVRSISRDVPVSSDGTQPALVLPLVHEVAARVAQRFPHAVVVCHAPARRAEHARVVVGGGEQGLRRIVENAVANACEGDGRSAARRVDVAIRREPEQRLVAIDVRDDGPGFPAHLLAVPIAPYAKTKNATGLGLYTTERLARAGGGFVRRENPPGGGARLTIYLAEARNP